MLFLVTWDFVDSSEEGERRSLEVFQNWNPPAGAEFKGFYGYADSTGGCAIIEVDSFATLARTTGPFVPWLQFNVKPLLTIEESAAISGEMVAMRANIG